MAWVAIPFRVRRPHRGGRGSAPPQLVAPEEAQDETERREHEKEREEQEDRRVDAPEKAREREPCAMGAGEELGEKRGEKEERSAERERDDGRGVPVTPEKEPAQEGEDASHGPSEPAICGTRCHRRILARPAHAAERFRLLELSSSVTAGREHRQPGEKP